MKCCQSCAVIYSLRSAQIGRNWTKIEPIFSAIWFFILFYFCLRFNPRSIFNGQLFWQKQNALGLSWLVKFLHGRLKMNTTWILVDQLWKILTLRPWTEPNQIITQSLFTRFFRSLLGFWVTIHHSIQNHHSFNTTLLCRRVHELRLSNYWSYVDAEYSESD